MKRRNCHVLIVTTFYQCSSSKESNEMTSVTQKLERDFLEAISEEMNSSQSRERANCTHHSPFIFHCNEHRFMLKKCSKKILGKSIAKNG